ncbi:hypothetical protein D3C76_1170440 [compost metagenome]
MEGLEDFHAGLAVARAVVQQQGVFGVEAALQADPHVGRVAHLREDGDRLRGSFATRLEGGQQEAFFLGAGELPEAQRDQQRQQRQDHQGRRQPRLEAGPYGPGCAGPASAECVLAILQGIPPTPTSQRRNHAMLKAAIVLLLLATVISLFSGLFYLVKDEGHGSRVVNALTVRVTLTALTLALIAWGFYSGQLNSAAAWHF